MDTEDKESSSNNDTAKSPSPTSNFDVTFTEFVRKMSENAQSSTPQGKENTSMNTNRDVSNSDTSTSSVILSGIIQSTIAPVSNIATDSLPTSSTSDQNASIPVATKGIPVTTSHIPVQTVPLPILSRARYSSWPDLPKPKYNKNKENEIKTRYSLPSSLKTALETEPIPIVCRPDLATNLTAQSNLPPKKSEAASESAKVTTDVTISSHPSLLTLEDVKNQIKAELASYMSLLRTTPPVKIESAPRKAKKIMKLSGPSRLALENNENQVEAALVPIVTKTAEVTNSPRPSTCTFGNTESKAVSFKDQPKDIPIYILKQAETENVKTPPVSSKTIQSKAKDGSALAKVNTVCVPSTSGKAQTKAKPAASNPKAKILKVYKAERVPTSATPPMSTPSTSTAHLLEVKGQTAKIIPVRALTTKVKRVPSSTGTKEEPSKSQIPDKTAIVPVKTAPVPVETEPLTVKVAPLTVTAVPLTIKDAPVPVKTEQVSVNSSTISLVSKAAQFITSLAEKAGQIESVAGPSTAVAISKKRSNDDNEGAMEVEYLDAIDPRGRGRPRLSGNKGIPSNNTAIEKLNPTPVEPPVKKRPGRPRKPFNFERIISGIKCIRLPNSFWSVKIKETPNWKQVCFSRAVLAKTDNPVKNDRVVRFTNSVKYSVQINNRNVKLLAAPPTVTTFKDVQILLRIVNDIQLHDPMLEFF